MKYCILFWVIFLLFLVGCDKEAGLSDFTVNRTVIVYMAADNDLSGDALVDLEEMQRGYTATGANLIVLVDVAGEAPYLLQIDETGRQTVKTYLEFNSADALKMKSVLGEIINMYPAGNYGLVLWSHGTSWLPAGVQLKSFAEDGGRQMDIIDLAAALPLRFDFILFDACLMGAVEVAYELKDKTDFLIASSTETIYKGFPYDLIISELLAPEVNLIQVAQKYFDYYDEQQGAYRSATISVTDTRRLDALAEATALVIGDTPFNMANFDRTAVQRLDVYNEQYVFDFLDFTTKAFPQTNLIALREQINKTVIYKAHTPRFIEEYDISTYCGLSCYIPHPQRNDLNTYYQQLKWCRAAGFSQLFKP
ncbi:MAG: hypothetical protein LBM08_12910 [Dysgonamonadaceae bacterium]|jgi:hypothetical protein|nr:hypothetical protein [Dysgonamonadaceae bacterium]